MTSNNGGSLALPTSPIEKSLAAARSASLAPLLPAISGSILTVLFVTLETAKMIRRSTSAMVSTGMGSIDGGLSVVDRRCTIASVGDIFTSKSKPITERAEIRAAHSVDIFAPIGRRQR